MAAKAATGSNRANKASIHAVIGASGSGKTSYVMDCLKRGKPSRLLVWDTKGEFAAEGYAKPISSIQEVARELIKAGARGGFKLAFRPKGDRKKFEKDFSRFCDLAYYAKNCWLIAEELQRVTRPSAAPAGWAQATCAGRSEGLTIYGLSQHPAQIDKDFFGNCSTIRTGRLNFKAHVETMAEALWVEPEEIQALEDGQFIHLQLSPRQLSRGRLF